MTTHIDCARCTARGLHCHDCIVQVLLGAPDLLDWDVEETAALSALAGGGLVPPLRIEGPGRDPRSASA